MPAVSRLRDPQAKMSSGGRCELATLIAFHARQKCTVKS